jgi:hypothetical protein
LLDYQVPLKANQADARVGKIDLLGVSDRGRLMVIELKVQPKAGGRRGDPPPMALLEGLRYAAILEGDFEAIASEARRRFGVKISSKPPILVVLAPCTWWRGWIGTPAAGAWGAPFGSLLHAIQTRIGLAIECFAFDDVQLICGLSGRAPRLGPVPKLYPVRYEPSVVIGDALPPLIVDREGAVRYQEAVERSLWKWADCNHAGQLDGGSRLGRPPVLQPKFAALNVLVTDEGATADAIRATIGEQQRHRHFASLRSSQALAQSVFGAIQAHDRFDILRDIKADCGRPAFFEDHRGWSLDFEHKVGVLDEPTPTSVDVLMTGPQERRVAIECKFTEGEFGRCSRPGLQPSNPQRCNGNYQAQVGRTARCALSAAGIQYWDHLPKLFDWPADRDHTPCLFGQVYQLARNALAASIAEDRQIKPASGHALIVYDANHPAFQAGGAATLQWETAAAACLTPGLLRRVTWQRLLATFARDPTLVLLARRLCAKYGFNSG